MKTTTIKFSLIRYLIGIFAAIAVALTTTGCSVAKSEDYIGSWMAIDESASSPKVYRFDITSPDGIQFTVRVSQNEYTVNETATAAVWKETAAIVFRGTYQDGILITERGEIEADPMNYRLRYGSMSLTRNAKNVEMKFRYVARDKVQSLYPGVQIVD